MPAYYSQLSLWMPLTKASGNQNLCKSTGDGRIYAESSLYHDGRETELEEAKQLMNDMKFLDRLKTMTKTIFQSLNQETNHEKQISLRKSKKSLLLKSCVCGYVRCTLMTELQKLLFQSEEISCS